MITRRRFLALVSTGTVLGAGCTVSNSNRDAFAADSNDGNESPGDITRVGRAQAATNQSNQGQTPTETRTTVPAKKSRVLDIRDFGAAVDGRTNDTVAVRDAVAAADRNDVVFFPRGETVVSGSDREDNTAIDLDGDSIPVGLTIAGAGRESVVRMADDQPRYHKLLSVTVHRGIEGLTIRDLRLDGNKGGQTIKPGSGGHGFTTDDANSAAVPVDVLLLNLWVENFNMTGLKPRHGGVAIRRCTVTGCVKHGAAPDSSLDVQKYDPPMTIRHCYFANNGLLGDSVTYGIDCSGGKVIVEDTVCEGNAQGTKTTEAGVDITYRRVRLQDNKLFGYIRAGSEARSRTRVTFEDVVASGNGNAGFRFSKDTDYVIPTEIVATDNQMDNVHLTEDARIDAETVWANKSRQALGLYSGPHATGRIANYYPYTNQAGPLLSLGPLEVGTQKQKEKTDIDGVPAADEVGAGSNSLSEGGIPSLGRRVNHVDRSPAGW